MRDIEAHIKVKYQSDDKTNEMWADENLFSHIIIKIFIYNSLYIKLIFTIMRASIIKALLKNLYNFDIVSNCVIAYDFMNIHRENLDEKIIHYLVLYMPDFFYQT